MTPAFLFAAAVAVAVSPTDSTLWQLPSLAYENPAVKQWMLPRSYSRVGVVAHYTDMNRPLSDLTGTGERYWGVDARSYMKSGSSTLWGTAHYDNGRQTGQRLSETSDMDVIYPYFTVDSVGGELKMEHYSFSGGYASHNDRWAWGAQASYDAGLYYRAVDPRPRNTTGTLNISAGAAYRVFGSYFAALSAGYMKYKQSNDIDFKSQMGVEKIYHYTGMGHHYVRFAGVGYDCDYSGHAWSMTANLYPSSGHGFTATAHLRRFSFSKILTDLNKLPLTRAVDTRLDAQATYTANVWGCGVDFDVFRRRGYENIFGDASSGIYPEIGTFHRFSHTGFDLLAKGAFQQTIGHGALLGLQAATGFARNEFVYISPAKTRRYDATRVKAEGTFSIPLNKWRVAVAANYDGWLPDNGVSKAGARISVARAINTRMALKLEGEYARTAYWQGVHANTFDASLSLVF